MEMCGAFSNWSCFSCFFSSVPQHSLSEKTTSWPFGVFLSLILIFGRGRGAVKDTTCTLHSNDC